MDRITRAEVTRAFARSAGVLSRDDIAALGVSRGTVRSALALGWWQQPLPGVVVGHGGPVTSEQMRRAALMYGGPGSMLSHRTAGVLHGLRVSELRIEIVVPHGRRLTGNRLLVVHQVRRHPSRVLRHGHLCTGVARTVTDIAVTTRRACDVTALVADAVQRGLTTVSAIARDAETAPQRGSGALTLALEAIGAGARSIGEAEFLQLVRRAGLPEPELNARIDTAAGTFYVDALWRKLGIGVEIDGAAWHLDPASWERDLFRQNAIQATGVMLLRFPVRRLRTEPQRVLAELRRALASVAA